jgi:hypothetical protein
MTLWNPVYRVKVNGTTATSATLAGLTITSGRTDIYSQPIAGYCNLTLIETNESQISYDINDSVTVEVKDSTGTYVNLFGGFITDVTIAIQTAGSTATSQRINIIAVGALARLNRRIFTGNVSHQFDGDRIYDLLATVLFNTWADVPGALTWSTYDATTEWQDAENSGVGSIDRPGDYELHSQTGLNATVLQLVSGYATSGLGYLFEDAQGQIGYADSTHRSQYLSANGYINLDGNHAYSSGLQITKRAGDIRNSITIGYGATSSATVSNEDLDSITLYGELAASVLTTLRHQADAEDQAEFYLLIRAYPQFLMRQIGFPIHSPEIDNNDRDALLGIFMGMPVNISNLPPNMVNGQFQGFIEGWTWTASYNRLDLQITVSPIAFSLQAYRWNSVPAGEAWNTLSNTLTWLDATIVA